MIESDVNRKVKDWAIRNGYVYKGIAEKGEVPVPTTLGNDVRIDAQIEKDPDERIWIEGKGDVGMSDMIQGLGRVVFATFYGGGKGLLAIDRKRTERLLQYKEFLNWFGGAINLGIFNVEDEEITWL